MLHRHTPKRNTCYPLCRRKGDFFVLCVDISMPFARKSARRLENSAVLVENSKRLADFCPMPLVVWQLPAGVSGRLLLLLSSSSLWAACKSFG